MASDFDNSFSNNALGRAFREYVNLNPNAPSKVRNYEQHTFVNGSKLDLTITDGTDDSNYLNSNAQVIFGMNGNDTLQGGSHTHSFIGGYGADIFVLNATPDAQSVNIKDFELGDKIDVSGLGIRFYSQLNILVEGKVAYITSAGTNLNLNVSSVSNLSALDASHFAFTIPTEAANRLSGESTDDFIDGLGGNDTLLGNQGDDTLYGSLGNDSIRGGREEDQLFGHQGADVLFGDLGNDTVRGGTENDILHGGQDNDLLEGGNGADSLYGERGDDTFSGGAGNDRFYSSIGADVILDFTAGDHITIYRSVIQTSAQTTQEFLDHANITNTTYHGQQAAFIDFSNGNTITIVGYQFSGLSADMFELS